MENVGFLSAAARWSLDEDLPPLLQALGSLPYPDPAVVWSPYLPDPVGADR